MGTRAASVPALAKEPRGGALLPLCSLGLVAQYQKWPLEGSSCPPFSELPASGQATQVAAGCRTPPTGVSPWPHTRQARR